VYFLFTYFLLIILFYIAIFSQMALCLRGRIIHMCCFSLINIQYSENRLMLTRTIQTVVKVKLNNQIFTLKRRDFGLSNIVFIFSLLELKKKFLLFQDPLFLCFSNLNNLFVVLIIKKFKQCFKQFKNLYYVVCL